MEVDKLGHYVRILAALHQLARPPGRHVDHILDEG